MSNPWDAPPPPDKGDATQEPIFTAIGRCVTTWEYIDHDLADMFSVFVGATDAFGDEPAMKSYGTIVSHRNRMEMVAAAADSYFRINRNDKLKDDFKELTKKCSGWASRRNDSAHGIVIGRKPDTDFLLYPGLYNSKKWGEHPKYAYSSSQIDEFARAIKALSQETSKFAVRLKDFAKARRAESIPTESEKKSP